MMTTKSRRRAVAIAAASLTMLTVSQLARAEENPFPQPEFDPNAPGVEGFTSLAGAISTYTAIGAVVAFVLSLLIAVIGPPLGFQRAGTVGKIGMLVSVGVAFLLGMVSVILNFAYNAGS